MSPDLKVPKNMICKLNKFIYGLKQASCQWNQKLTSTLINLGYHQSRYGYSLFTKKYVNSFTIILIYVDDLILAGNDLT